jgi:hypothetical protein
MGGEIPAARELNRVLAPGGIAIITVPFSKKYFAEYVRGSVYERTADDGELTFFKDSMTPLCWKKILLSHPL